MCRYIVNSKYSTYSRYWQSSRYSKTKPENYKRSNDPLCGRIAQNCFRQKSQEPRFCGGRLALSGQSRALNIVWGVVFWPLALVSFSSKHKYEDGGVGNRPRPQSLPHSQHRNWVWPKHSPGEWVGKYSWALQHTHSIGYFSFFTSLKRNICQDQRTRE